MSKPISLPCLGCAYISISWYTMHVDTLICVSIRTRAILLILFLIPITKSAGKQTKHGDNTRHYIKGNPSGHRQNFPTFPRIIFDWLKKNYHVNIIHVTNLIKHLNLRWKKVDKILVLCIRLLLYKTNKMTWKPKQLENTQMNIITNITVYIAGRN